jgi:O-Antigen ligase
MGDVQGMRIAALLAASLGFFVIAPLALTDGGYWPPAWGWTATGLLWVSIVALLLFDRLRLGRLGIVMLASLVALFAWTLMSHLWSSASQSPLESQRTLVYLAGAATPLFLLRRPAARSLLAGVCAAIVVASAFGLATRLFPEHLGEDPGLAAHRLREPLGYWNAVGILAAIGTLVALGFSAHARGTLRRALAACSLPLLLVTLYFTFSRGAWIALGAALPVVLAIDRRRLAFITTALAVLPFSALAVWLSSRPDALNTEDAPLADASREGERLALYVLGLAIASGLVALVVGELTRRLDIPRSLRLVYAGALVAIAIAGTFMVFARFGSPVTIVDRAYSSLKGPPPATEGDFRDRLFNLSSQGRVRQWRVAWDGFKRDPWIGAGAGTYEQSWYQHRPHAGKVRDAHSLYLETLAELGIVGLALVLLFLGVPLVAAVKARRHALVPAACGAYVAFLVHAGVDWDWEMPVVTLSVLFCGASILVYTRENAPAISARLRFGLVAIVVALSAFSFVGLIGNSAVAASNEAREDGKLEEAESEARKATRWMGWSVQPWRELALAELASGDVSEARKNFRKAITRDDRDWRVWYGLALVSEGKERRSALARARQLNPLGSLPVYSLQGPGAR